MKKNAFEDSLYSKLLQWAYWLLMANLCFTISNLPLFLLTSVGFTFGLLPYYLLASLLILPSFVAIFSCLTQFRETKELRLTKDYFHYFRKSFLPALPISLLMNFCLFALYVAINYVSNVQALPFLPIFYTIITVLVISFATTYGYFLANNPQLSIPQLARASFYLSLKRWYLSLLNTFLYTLCHLALFLKPAIGFFILPTVFASLIYLNSRSFLGLQSVGASHEKS